MLGPSPHRPLCQGEEGLKKEWARWRHMVRKQPIDEIR